MLRFLRMQCEAVTYILRIKCYVCLLRYFATFEKKRLNKIHESLLIHRMYTMLRFLVYKRETKA